MAHTPHARAGFVSRAIAFIIDIVAMSVLVLGAIALTYTLLGFFTLYGVLGRATVSGPLRTGVTTALALFGIVIAVGYPVGCWVFFGQTPGKALLGLRVTRSDGKPVTLGHALLRYVGYWVSAIPLGLGFLWVLGDSGRRGWHDRLAGTCVVYAWQPDARPTLAADGSPVQATT